MPSKRHHFVPRFHLRHFAIPDGGTHIFQYSKNGGTPVRASTKDVGCRKGFYSLNTEPGPSPVDHESVERLLAGIDGRGASAVGALSRFGVLDESGLEQLCLYIGALVVRTPSYVAMLKSLGQPIVQEMAERMLRFDRTFRERLRRSFTEDGHIHEEEVDALFDRLANGGMKVSPSHSATIAIAIAQIPKLAIGLRMMSWIYITPRDLSQRFVISDQPVFYCDPVTNKSTGIGLASANVEVTVPISSRVCAIGSMEGNCSNVFEEVSDDAVAEVNRRTIISSECYLYGSESNNKIEALMREFKNSCPYVVTSRVDDFPHPGGLAMPSTIHFPTTGFTPMVRGGLVY